MEKQRLEFGTAGIRGKIGLGQEFLNLAYVKQIITGFALYLIDKYQNTKEKIVVIGRDNRNMSKEFAYYAAKILSNYNIKVKLSQPICPTPFVSFAILNYQAIGGINITASHNPKEYNGIKLYNPIGGQCLPEEIEEIKNFFPAYDSKFEKEKVNFLLEENVEYIPENMYVDFYQKVLKIDKLEKIDNVKILYSPLHGTGLDAAKFIKQNCFKNPQDFNLDTLQAKEDIDFSNCKNPNPETKEAYEVLIEIDQKSNHIYDALIVTDPDSDRVGIVIYKNDQYYYLNGNETAIIIFDYLLKTKKPNSNDFLCYSYVSTNLPAVMANEHRMKIYEVPTGFKWMGKIINEHPQENLYFAFEESYGSLIDSNISRDKDAIQSLYILTKIISYYKKQNKDIVDVLDSIYKKYGYVESKNINVNLQNNDFSILPKIQKSFKDINFKDATLIDYNLATDFTKSNMLKYVFKDNSWIALRPSGTEPKIKFYIFAYGKTKELASKKYVQLEQQILNILK